MILEGNRGRDKAHRSLEGTRDYLRVPVPFTVDCPNPSGRITVEVTDRAAPQKAGSITGLVTATNWKVMVWLAIPEFGEKTSSPCHELIRFTTRAVLAEIIRKLLRSPAIKSLPSSAFCELCLLRVSKLTAPEMQTIVACELSPVVA